MQAVRDGNIFAASDGDGDLCGIVSTRERMEGKRIEDIRVNEGRCPSCGTQCFKLKTKGWGKKKKTVRKPLTVRGMVQCGDCLHCRKDHQYEDAAIAAAFASVEEEQHRHQQQQQRKPQNYTGNSKNRTTRHDLPTLHRQNKGNTVYIGDFNIYGNRDGHGELVWSNGDRYVGDFFNGKRHGKGTLYFQDGSEFVGEWECNYMHGKGTRRFPNGDVYMGKYVDGKRSGIGRFYFANGDMYYGNWCNDKIDGFGRFYYNTGIRFEGTFKEGKRHGKGKLQRPDGQLDIFHYDENDRVYPGLRWSADRTKTWKILNGGKVIKSISVAEAVSLGYKFEDNGVEDDELQHREAQQFVTSSIPHAHNPHDLL